MKTLKAYFFKRPTVAVLLTSIVLFSPCVNAKTTESDLRRSQILVAKNMNKKKSLSASKKLTKTLSPQKNKTINSENPVSVFTAKNRIRNGSDESHLQRLKMLSTNVESLKAAAQKTSSPFGLTMILSKFREAETPDSGQYSLNETTFIFVPSYAVTDNYTLAAKVLAIHDSDDSSKSLFKLGVLKVMKNSFSINKYVDASPAVTYGFPVNSKQRDDSFQGSLGANINFSLKKDTLDKVSLSVLFGYTKSFYKYKTELNLDPTADDIYNSEYSTLEYIDFKYHLLSKLSFGLTLANKQAWDYANEQKNSYDLVETLNWEIADSVTLFGGLENEEAAKVSQSSLIYRFYNTETSSYILGLSVSI